MLAISAIYQNGDYGFDQDTARAFAWSVLVNGKDNKKFNPQFDYLKSIMNKDQLLDAQSILAEISKKYNNDAAYKKFTKWYNEVTAVTGSRLAGNHSYLNLQITTNTGRKLSSFEFFEQLEKIRKEQELDNQEVIQHEIITIEE